MLKCDFSVVKDTEVQTIITQPGKKRTGFLKAKELQPQISQLSSAVYLFSGLDSQPYRD